MKRSVRYVGGVLAVALTAALVPPAFALSRPDDQAEPRGPGAISATPTLVTIRPDDRAEPRGPGVLPSASVRPDDRATHGVGSTVMPVVVAESSEFDWRYVTIAGSVAVLAALVVGAVVMTRHHGGPGRLAPHA